MTSQSRAGRRWSTAPQLALRFEPSQRRGRGPNSPSAWPMPRAGKAELVTLASYDLYGDRQRIGRQPHNPLGSAGPGPDHDRLSQVPQPCPAGRGSGCVAGHALSVGRP